MNVNERINGFDALRSVAMWLGVVLHGIIVYKGEAEPNWPHENDSYQLLNWAYDFIHIFRMPLFFMVAGFFSCMVIAKIGIKDFLKQRTKRILIPFVAGILIIVPLSLFPFSINQYYYNEQTTLSVAFQKSIVELFQWKGLAHLWFLYYLILFYAIAAIIVKLTQSFSFQSLFNNRGLLAAAVTILFIVIQSLTLDTFKANQPPVYTGIKPNLFFLLYYGSFFTFGWWMYRLQIILTAVKKTGLFLLVVGLALFIIRRTALQVEHGQFIYSLAAVETCFIVLGISGLFLRYFNKESKAWRYFSDASYWVYLTHLFIVASVQVALLSVSNIPSWIKLAIVFITAFIITMVTYSKFVRTGIIGEYLHGKRKS
jgi:glucans biosynthesis protein C